MVSWPAQLRGGRVIDTPIISFDILPTVLDALNESPPETEDFDGKSILPLLKGKDHPHHNVLYWDTGDEKMGWAVRKGNWKLIGKRQKLELSEMPEPL